MHFMVSYLEEFTNSYYLRAMQVESQVHLLTAPITWFLKHYIYIVLNLEEIICLILKNKLKILFANKYFEIRSKIPNYFKN